MWSKMVYIAQVCEEVLPQEDSRPALVLKTSKDQQCRIDGDEEGDRYPFTFEPIPKTLTDDFQQLFTGYDGGLVRSKPGGLVATPAYAAHAESVYRMKPRSDDIWLVTFPKSGTTWTSELLWLLVNNCNLNQATQVPLSVRTYFPNTGHFNKFVGEFQRKSTLPQEIDKLPSPRIIRPHMPFSFLPPGLIDISKVVYVARNPKDVIVSDYFHHKMMHYHGYQGDIEEFAQLFMDNEVLFTPYFPHILEAWNMRHHPNMHFMFYEDMKKDLAGEIEKVAAFLNIELTRERVVQLADHLALKNFEKNKAVNRDDNKETGAMKPDGKFIRNGKVGDWKNHFSHELNKKMDRWIEDSLRGTDLTFTMELENQD